MSSAESRRSPEALKAIKEERLRKLFEAMGKPSSEKLQDEVKPSGTKTKPQQQVKQGQSSSSGATSSAAPSQLSDEGKKRLTELCSRISDKPSKLPANVAERDSLQMGLHMLQSIPPSKLPTSLSEKQRQALMLREPIEDLLKTPDESLSPELQALKRRVTDIRANMPKDPYESREVERRINAALEAEGEPPVKMPYGEFRYDFSGGPGVEPKRIFKEKDLEAEGREVGRRMSDLARRKPKLHAQIYQWVVEHDAHLNKNRQA